MNDEYRPGTMLKERLLTSNPLFIEALGFSPAVIVASDLKTAVAISVFTLFALVFSGLIISKIREFIYEKADIVIYTAIAAGIALIEEVLAKALFPSLYENLGVFFPFVAFNCLVIAFAAGFASKNKTLPTLLCSLFSGAGFAMALCVFASVREVAVRGTLFGASIFGEDYQGLAYFSHPAGILMTAGFVGALFGAFRKAPGKTAKNKEKGEETKDE